MRRRAFLQFTALTGTTVAQPTPTNAVGDVDPAQVLADQLGDVLLGPAPVGVLAKALTAARQEFTTCHYLPLATRLPALITAAEASAAQRVDPIVQRVLAESCPRTG